LTGAQNGSTPLMLACVRGHVAVARILLQFGADINLKSGTVRRGEAPVKRRVRLINRVFFGCSGEKLR